VPSDGAPLIVKKNCFVDVGPFIERAVGLNESTLKNRLAGAVDGFELNPGLLHIPQLRWERVSGPAIEHNHFRCHFFLRFKLYRVFS